ncbi:MAG: hypothetical protein ACJ768_22980 [Gaiellaceae bacterium]
MIASTLGDIGSLVGGLAALGVVVGGFFAAQTAIAQLRVQAEQAEVQADQAKGERRENRGRWLTELSARFSDTPSFVAVREQLHEREDSPLVAALERRQAADASKTPLSLEDAKLLVPLDDYLDFLGLIQYLVQNDYLDEYAAWSLFDWYVIDQLDIPAVNREIDDSFHQVAELRKLFQKLRAQNP